MKIAIPNKGRLADGALELFSRAGLRPIGRGERALMAALGNDIDALFVRARDIPEFVADGAADLGITGRDMVAESGRELESLLDLEYGRCRLVVAAHEDGISNLDGLAAGARVATAFPRIATGFFADRGDDVTIVPVSGAAEIAPHLGVAEIIVDLVSTGSTLKVNGLVEIATILESSAVLISRKDDADRPSRRRTEDLVAALESVLQARDKRYLMANVLRDTLDEVARVLPGISGPTVVDVIDSGDWVAAHAVVDSADVYRAIGDLKRLGATGILVTKIERLMP